MSCLMFFVLELVLDECIRQLKDAFNVTSLHCSDQNLKSPTTVKEHTLFQYAVTPFYLSTSSEGLKNNF